ncbi:MAG: O-methyltransferase [Flavobacteriales bacterium]
MRDLTSYALHLGKARGRYRIHSPFVHELLENTLRDDSPRPAYRVIEERKNGLQKNRDRISVKDMGAGSKWSKKEKRRIRDIATCSGVDKRYGRLLYRLAERFAPSHAVELGSSLGIGTLYLAGGCKGSVHSIEGCPNSAAIARESIEQSGFGNATILQGDLQEELPPLLEQLPWIDLMRIDGDHRGSALLHYFERGMEKAHNDTLFILDDIHWSPDMEKAWETLKKDPRVTLTLDLYRMGLLFLRKEQKDPIHLRIGL